MASSLAVAFGHAVSMTAMTHDVNHNIDNNRAGDMAEELVHPPSSLQMCSHFLFTPANNSLTCLTPSGAQYHQHQLWPNGQGVPLTMLTNKSQSTFTVLLLLFSSNHFTPPFLFLVHPILLPHLISPLHCDLTPLSVLFCPFSSVCPLLSVFICSSVFSHSSLPSRLSSPPHPSILVCPSALIPSPSSLIFLYLKK